MLSANRSIDQELVRREKGAREACAGPPSRLHERLIVRHPHHMKPAAAARCYLRRLSAIGVLLASATAGLGGIQQFGQRQVNEAVFEAYRRAEPLTDWPLKKLLHEIPGLRGLDPATDQSALPGILSRIGDSVKDLLANFVNTTAVETIEETRLRNYPPTEDGVVERFHYLMLLKPEGGETKVEEYRTDSHGRKEQSNTVEQGFVKTVGFASMPLYFSSMRRGLSDFRYLGSQTIGGRHLQVVGFAEHPRPEGSQGGIMLAGKYIPAIYQGIAWIDPATCQILRMRTDLLAPLPAIRLSRETTEVRFRDVNFAKAPAPLLLPEEVDVTVGLGDLTYVNRHHYSGYEVFNVSTDQQVTAPKAGPGP